jgi:hypothetical protein
LPTKKTTTDTKPGKAATKSAAKTASTKSRAAKTATKRFRVSLEQLKGSMATVITIPFDVEKVFGTRARVSVSGTINGFAFRSSIFPTGKGTHYMVVNKDVRAGAQVRSGETITVSLQRDTEARVIIPPADLSSALRKNRQAQAAWDMLSYSHQREHARAVEEAKRPETRARRIENALAALTAENKLKG